MSKPTRGATKAAPGKKKAKVRPQPRPAVEATPPVVSDAAVQAEENGSVAVREPVLQFRPRPRESVQSRVAAAKAPTGKAAVLPVTDYSYVYTDLRIIAVLVAALLVALIALSFVIR